MPEKRRRYIRVFEWIRSKASGREEENRSTAEKPAQREEPAKGKKGGAEK